MVLPGHAVGKAPLALGERRPLEPPGADEMAAAGEKALGKGVIDGMDDAPPPFPPS